MSIDGTITQYFSTSVTADDEGIFGQAIGSHTGQQLWEFLALLVALRTWGDRLVNGRTKLSLRGDNVGALTLALKLRPKCRNMALIAREIALVTGHMAFPPKVLHTPGVAHVLADQLSSCSEEEVNDILKHSSMKFASRALPAYRIKNWSWYRTL